uniref:Uncharacterized protein n=1 Tax=Fagus sylvatica TaxID=28930 RepID=A0A2N9IAM2_FAGSY
MKRAPNTVELHSFLWPLLSTSAFTITSLNSSKFLEIPEKKCLFDLGGFAFEMAKRAPNTAQNTKDTFGTL